MVELHPARAAHLLPDLEATHCRVICEEIGHQLRQNLTDGPPPPMRLKQLIDQIAELEGNSPSEPPYSSANQVSDWHGSYRNSR